MITEIIEVEYRSGIVLPLTNIYSGGKKGENPLFITVFDKQRQLIPLLSGVGGHFALDEYTVRLWAH